MNEEAPRPPAPNECCESGCDPCVWDLYYAALREWQAQQAPKNHEQQATPPTDEST